MSKQYDRDELIAIQILCENRAVEVQRVIDTNPDALPSIKRDNERYIAYLVQLRNKTELLIG